MILRFGGSAEALISEMYQTMLDAILFVILGLVVFWLLAAIFEARGFTKHRHVARGFAALLTIAGAWIRTGTGIGGSRVNWNRAAFVYLQILRNSPDKSGQDAK